jgi:hydroxylaminobenzene mutase
MVISLQKNLQSKRLLFLGVLLFFLGLLVGLFIPVLANPRMGLSSHLEGVLNGIFLLALGLIWERLDLSQKWLNAAFWLTVYGSFANFLAVLIAAATGAGKMMPLAGGQEGSGMVEAFVSFLLISLSLAMLTACFLVLIGLYNHLKSKK